MEQAENHVVRLPGNGQPNESHDAAEVREDARLLDGIAEGDPHALAALYRRRSGLLYSLLVRMLVNEMEAQEVVRPDVRHDSEKSRQTDSLNIIINSSSRL